LALGPRKKPTDFDDNPDHITLGFWLRLRLGGTPPYFAREDCVIWRLFDRDNFATSVALAEVCVLLSVVLMLYGAAAVIGGGSGLEVFVRKTVVIRST